MKTMDDIQLIEAIERYLNGEMSNTEMEQFESMRKSTPQIDQMVVEHSMFLHEMDAYSRRKNFSKTTENNLKNNVLFVETFQIVEIC